MPSQISDTAHLGHQRDVPDPRDVKYVPNASLAVPPSTDLRSNVPPAYNQGQIKACSATAISSALQFLAKKAGAAIDPPSRLFIYYNERMLAGTQDSDAGSTLRNGIKAVNKQGACAETLWPYDSAKVCTKPEDACYEKANTHAVSYASITQSIDELKACLAEGYPFVFGMGVYRSMFAPAADYSIPMPGPTEARLGDHAVMAAGYDDTRQALLVLNSVGSNWGNQGYFYMPYTYATDPDLTYDFWTIRKLG